ncbi:unnamed protein product [Medioppia subpectinata]|uniref:Secreted protein n=1 Tax=Medioppia subpectinata TaxID=1979941 RepID=A0A7R9KCE2_9ACAR|nr:unnamed protein product [Medioppia subpectinata]CAG2100922.1 unnamed protein product [Medioppia subpectinata]
MRVYLVASFMLITIGLTIACNSECETLTAYYDKCITLLTGKHALNRTIAQNLLGHLTIVTRNIMNNLETTLNAMITSATDVADLDKWCDRMANILGVFADKMADFIDECILSGDQQIITFCTVISRHVLRVLTGIHESCNGLDFDEFDEELQQKVQSVIEKCHDIIVTIEGSGLSL